MKIIFFKVKENFKTILYQIAWNGSEIPYKIIFPSAHLTSKHDSMVTREREKKNSVYWCECERERTEKICLHRAFTTATPQLR